jgi:carbon-monoxide dehydrogenase medium subunit
MAPVAFRAESTAAALRGKPLIERAIATAAEMVDDGVDALDDLHGSAEYRRRVARGLTRRAIAEAARRAHPAL